MKAFLAAIKSELLQIVLLLLVIGIPAYIAWRNLTGGRTAEDVAADAAQGAVDIVNGLPSVVSAKLNGEDERTYMTDADMRRAAAESLAKTRAAKAAGG